MKNYKLEYCFDGYKFWDVVRADNEVEAKDYFIHETEDGPDKKVVQITETELEPTFIAPAGYAYKPLTFEEQIAKGKAEWDALPDEEKAKREEKAKVSWELLFGKLSDSRDKQ